MTKNNLLHYIQNETNKNHVRENYFKKHFNDFYSDMILYKYPEEFTFPQKLYHYLNDDMNFTIGKCKICGKRCNYKNFTSGYYTYCSRKCSLRDEETQNKIKQTSLDRYGVESYSKTQEYLHKVKETNLSKYGVDSYSKTTEYKNKTKQTNLSKYGVEHVLQNSEILHKKEQTCLDKYGVKNFSQSDGYLELSKKSNLSKYGVEHVLQNSEILHKKEQTCLDKYGVKNFTQSDIFYDKIYDVYLPKKEQTCLDKYGKKSFSQTSEYHLKKTHKIYSKLFDISFDSSWELKCAEFCFYNNIVFQYQPNILFEYHFNNDTHYYQPDFLINGKLYEIKGDHFFEGDKMINPYDRNQDGLYEAKHQCMIKNNVIILKNAELENLKLYLHK